MTQDHDETPASGTPTPQPTSGRDGPRTFAALGIRSYRIVWAGTWLSFTGFFMSTVVQSVVAFELTGSNTAVGSVVFANGLAMAGLSPVGGALADRVPKRRIVASGQGATCLIFAVLGILIALEWIDLLSLATGSLAMGAAFAFVGPARQALVVEIVPQRLRANAISLSQIANTGSRVIGPVLAGMLLAWPLSGASGAYLAMAGCYGLSALLLLFIPRSRVPAPSTSGLLDGILEGLRYVNGQRRLRLILVLLTLVIMMGFPHVTILPGLLENQLGRDATQVSLLFGSSAVGALGASIFSARFAGSRYGATLFGLFGLLFGVSLAGLAAAPSFEAAAAAMLLIGIGSGGFHAIGMAVIAQECDPALIGRVLSLTMLSFAGFGLTALPFGALADATSERTTLAVMAAAVTLLSLGLLAILRASAKTPPSP